MPGYQPRHDTDPVWYNGTKINHLDLTSTGVGVRVTAIFGWDDRPDVRDARVVRSGQDGEWADQLYLGGRTITIEGEVYGSTWANLQSRKRTLSAIFNPTTDEVLFKVPDPATASPTTSYSETGMTGYERVYARVIESIQFGETLDPMCQTFQVVLKASDPRVYSDVATSTDSGTSGTGSRTVAVDQGGSYETPAILTVTAPTGSTWSVSESNSELSLNMDGLALASSATVEFDTQERSAYMTASYEAGRLALAPLEGLWMLDETSGTTADNQEGTSAIDGTYTGGYTLNQSGFATGIASVDLNGTTGYVAVPGSAALMTGSEFTWEGWFYPDSLATSMMLVDFTDWVNQKGWRIRVVGGALEVTVGFGTVQSTVTTGPPPPGQPVVTLTASTWQHIAVTTIDNVWSIYINGELIRSSDLSSVGTYVPADAADPITFGRANWTGALYWNGKIAAQAFYSTAYGANTIRQLYEASQDTNTTNVYGFLTPSTSAWGNLETAAATYTLASSGLNTGSKLNVTYRDARL
jgi:hypothetical protein